MRFASPRQRKLTFKVETRAESAYMKFAEQKGELQ